MLIFIYIFFYCLQKNWQTNYRLQYKIFISQDKNVLKGEHLLVKDPPAIHEPASKSSVYYIAVSLVDNHGYEGPLSEIYHLYTKEIGNDFSICIGLLFN